MSQAGLDVQGIVRLCRRCHNLPGRPCGRWITRSIARIAGEPLPQEALEIAAWYATEDPDPAHELWRTPASGDIPYSGGDILAAAINSVRGSAAENIAELIFRDGGRLAFFRPALKRMVRDPSVAVRCCVADALVAVLRYDRDLAVRLFLTLYEIDEDRLLATRDAERFLAFGLRTHFRELSPVVSRMLSSPASEVATAGARQGCIAGLVTKEAKRLAGRCLKGSDAQRLGAAQVFAANLAEAPLRSFCENALRRLFHDRSKDVRTEAAHCFRSLDRMSIAPYEKLVRTFALSPAFADAPYSLIQAMTDDTAPLPKAVCLVGETFVTVFSGEARTIQTRAGGEAGRVSQLVIRLYSQTTVPKVLTRCLDLVDRMIATGIFGVDDALGKYERS